MTANGERRHGTSTVKPARSSRRIADVDRPAEGALIVSQQPLIDVRQSMNPTER